MKKSNPPPIKAILSDDGSARVDSKILAKRLGVSHKSLMNDISICLHEFQ